MEMKVLFAWLLSMVLVRGAETVAWQVSLERVVEGGVKSPKLVRLEVPPAESVFFEEGDELWDLMGTIVIERWVPDDPAETAKGDPGKRVQGKFAGEWLVWNARSKRVVGRGSWDELEEIDGRLVYEQVRSTLVVEKNGRAEESVVTVCGSGERAEEKEGKLVAKVAPNLSWDRGLIDLNYEVKIDMGDGRYTEVTSAASIHAGRAVVLAEWGGKGERYELLGTFDIVSVDGVLVDSVRQREVGERAIGLEELGLDFRKFDGISLENGLKVGVFHIAPDFVCRVIEDHPASEFGFPPELEEISSGYYEDLMEGLNANGVSFDSRGSMALVNHSTLSLIAVNDQVNLDKIEAVVKAIKEIGPASVSIEADWGDQSGAMLMRSGEMGVIRQVRAGVIENEFNVAPNVAADNREVEFSFSLKVPGQGVSLESSATMIDGESLLVGEFGREGKVILEVKVERD